MKKNFTSETRDSIFKLHRAFSCDRLLACGGALFFTLLCSPDVRAESANFLYKIRIKPGSDHTRLTLALERESVYSLSVIPGNRLKITFPMTSSVQSKKLRSYRDQSIDGISFEERNNNAVVTVSLKGEQTGYRLIAGESASLLTIDVGPGIRRGEREVRSGRERIWSGTERLIREFEPPLRPDVPFIPTDGKFLRKFLTKADAELFLRGEAALYKERPAEAGEIFGRFFKGENPVRAVAAYRMGEALYMMQKYADALASFREGERLNSEYITQNPSAIFYFADSLVRNGDFEAGRRLMVRLVIGLSATEHGPSMLVRLADMYARAGRENEAMAIYRNVTGNFPGSKAYYGASMRLNDREFFAVNELTYHDLVEKYAVVEAKGPDQSLREEALFKAALLEAIYGPAQDAVDAVSEYERKYPRGIFANVAKTMREELLFQLYRELESSGDCRKLIELVGENRDYLAKCLPEEGFIRLISRCYRKQGKVREEMKLFMELVDSEWATASLPFMYRCIFDDALALGEEALAAGAARTFLEKYPRHPLAWGVVAALGEIHYRKGNMHEVISILACLEEKGSVAEQPESFYYLGKARESCRDLSSAERNMVSYLGELEKKGLTSPLVADAFRVRADARLARGDRKGAMAMYRNGYAAARGEMRDALLFKMGDLAKLDGSYAEAREMWESLLSEGTDPFWKEMASRELSDLEWRQKWKY